jgi:hypothetical protein
MTKSKNKMNKLMLVYPKYLLSFCPLQSPFTRQDTQRFQENKEPKESLK